MINKVEAARWFMAHRGYINVKAFNERIGVDSADMSRWLNGGVFKFTEGHLAKLDALLNSLGFEYCLHSNQVWERVNGVNYKTCVDCGKIMPRNIQTSLRLTKEDKEKD